MQPQPDVLVVDDEAESREGLSVLLGIRGYRVASAANGMEALSLLQHGMRPALILLDLMMPVMNGWEFMSHQLNDPNIKSIPVVITSGLSLSEMGSIEPAGVVRKPINPDILLDLVQKHTS